MSKQFKAIDTGCGQFKVGEYYEVLGSEEYQGRIVVNVQNGDCTHVINAEDFEKYFFVPVQLISISDFIRHNDSFKLEVNKAEEVKMSVCSNGYKVEMERYYLKLDWQGIENDLQKMLAALHNKIHG